MFFPNYSATFDCRVLWKKHNSPKSKVAEYLGKHGKSSKIKKNLDYLGVFIHILLVLGKNPCSLAAKL